MRVLPRVVDSVGHLAVALVGGHRRLGLVDRELKVVRAHAVALGV